MSHELSRDAVSRRLERLRRLYVPERDADARRRLEADAERARREVPFEEAVARRLGELRALLELTRHLHRSARTLRR